MDASDLVIDFDGERRLFTRPKTEEVQQLIGWLWKTSWAEIYFFFCGIFFFSSSSFALLRGFLDHLDFTILALKRHRKTVSCSEHHLEIFEAIEWLGFDSGI